MSEKMNESKILDHITELVDEEHRIYSNKAVSAQDRDKLKHIAEQLDQCWDLLRQRRARLEFDADPEGVSMRDVKTVEGYIG